MIEVVNRKSLKIAAVIWSLMTFSGYQTVYFFSFKSLNNLKVCAGISSHIIHFLFLLLSVNAIRSVYIRRKEPLIRRGISLGFTYGIIAGVLLILVWPGLWSWDDIMVLKNAQSYALTPWQHFFSSLFQEMALLTFPFPAGVLIAQILITAAIVGYVGAMLGEVLAKYEKNKYIIGIILVGIALLPPVIIYTLSGFRMGIYTFVELFLLVRMYVWYKLNYTLTKSELIKILCLTIIVGTWRTEAIFYPLIIYLPLSLMKKNISKRYLGILLVMTLVVILGMNKINSTLIGLGSHGKDDYALLSSMVGTVELIKNDTDILNDDEIDKIDKVLNVQVIKQHKDYSAELLFWNSDLNVIRKDYSQRDLREYYLTYARLCLKHPISVTKPMIDIFGKSMGCVKNDNGVSMQRTMHEYTLKMFSEKNSANAKEWDKVIGLGKMPLNMELRTMTVNFLFGTDAQYRKNFVGSLMFNVLIPLSLLLFSFAIKLYKKRYFEVGILLLLIMRVPIIFATAPAPYLMYYLSIYLCSYVFFFAFLMEEYKKIR